MDEPKAMTGLNQGRYDYPLADVSHLSPEEKRDLLRRGMQFPEELHSDEEFEQWVTVFSEYMSKKNLSLLMDGFMGEANQSEPVLEQAVVQAAEQVKQPAVQDDKHEIQKVPFSKVAPK